MARRKGGIKGGPLAKEAELLGPEFCSTVDVAPEEVLRDMLKQLPLDRINLQERLKGDVDVKSLKDALSLAMTDYRTGFKRMDAKAARIRRRLKEMGKPVGEDSEQADKKLEPGTTDKFGGTNANAIAGKPIEPRPSAKEAERQKTEAAVRDFEQKAGGHLSSPFNPPKAS